MTKKNISQRIFNGYRKYLQSDMMRLASGSENFTPINVPPKELIDLIHEVELIFASEPVQLNVNAPCYIVGDLHGHFIDLLRILQKYGTPSESKYLFLGDLVDRGSFSLETITLVIAMKKLFPENIFVIRGNHEFDDLCTRCGFQQELKDLYPNNELYPHFSQMFSQMPLSAIVAGSTLCIHGGLGPLLYSTKQLTLIERPLTEFGDPIIDSILWSDPVDSIDNFEASHRGSGYCFGAGATREFLSSTKLKRIVRGHECVKDGIQEMFGGLLLTVFSASNYCGLVGNSAAVLQISEGGDCEYLRMQPLPYLTRAMQHTGVPTLKRGSMRLSATGSSGFFTTLPVPAGLERPTASSASCALPSPGSTPRAPLIRPAISRGVPLAVAMQRMSDPVAARRLPGAGMRRRMSMAAPSTSIASSPLLS